MKNRLEMVRNIRLKFNSSDIVKNEKFEDYPWDQCVADQIERYGDEETAKKVCGAIKAGLKKTFAEGDSLENACWNGYIAKGLKQLEDGRMVPNCVPDKEEQSKQEFVIPTPEGGEDENTFISRCMGELNAEFPDESQRAAVCYKSWRGE